MASITSVTSEALQAAIRRLLPSQQGFGEDLQASNVITPIIDLTATAEGSQLPTNLQQAINFGGATTFDVANTSATVASAGGFYRIIGGMGIIHGSAAAGCQVIINDGTTDKVVYASELNASGTFLTSQSVNIDFNVFLRPTDSLIVKSLNAGALFVGSVRQIADLNGNSVDPVGYTPQ